MNWLRVISYTVLIILVIPVLLLLYEGFGPMRTPSGYSSGVFRSIELTLVGSAIAVVVCSSTLHATGVLLCKEREYRHAKYLRYSRIDSAPDCGNCAPNLGEPAHFGRAISRFDWR